MTPEQAKRLRVGTKVRFNPTPASHALYSRCPSGFVLGEVTTVPFGGGVRKSFLPGPGGGLVYVNWSDIGVCGVSAFDVERAKET
jgi:hypothetical protein